MRDGAVFGVFHLDSPLAGRFDAEDQADIEAIVATYIAQSEWDG